MKLVLAKSTTLLAIVFWGHRISTVDGFANDGSRRHHSLGSVVVDYGLKNRLSSSTRLDFSQSSSSSWQDRLQQFFTSKVDEKPSQTTIDSDTSSSIDHGDGSGTVIRLAGRKYNKDSSKPSSREYTTRKNVQPSINITYDGVDGDYNHYRTVALDSTKDRAISILTTDVMNALMATYPSYVKLGLKDGDLGENILIDNIPFTYFQIGKQYEFIQSSEESKTTTTKTDNTTNNNVVIEITEPMEPCGNLCKLPYINDDSILPKERIQRCQDFISYLGRYDGYRGWYAKVINPGILSNGDTIVERRE